jgi:hypothetical protein
MRRVSSAQLLKAVERGAVVAETQCFALRNLLVTRILPGDSTITVEDSSPLFEGFVGGKDDILASLLGFAGQSGRH